MRVRGARGGEGAGGQCLTHRAVKPQQDAAGQRGWLSEALGSGGERTRGPPPPHPSAGSAARGERRRPGPACTWGAGARQEHVSQGDARWEGKALAARGAQAPSREVGEAVSAITHSMW